MAYGNRAGICLAALIAIASCASSGVMTVDKDTYMISKRSAQMGFGPPVAATAYVYKEANAYCANLKKKVETLRLDQVDSAFGRPAAASLRFRCVSSDTKSASEQCKADLDTPELDPIRQKVELYRDSWESAVPFAIATNDAFPTQAERVAIAKWAALREECIKRNNASLSASPSVSALQVTQIQQDRSFAQAASAGVSDLIVSLYQQKLTYGEFAKRRYEITSEASNAERRYREGTQLRIFAPTLALMPTLGRRPNNGVSRRRL
jgi:hypothetical protein